MSPEEPQPLASDTARMLEIGTALWSVALVVSLLLPTLHRVDRQWWPWACAAGMVGGGLSLLYVRRGRGNAESAHLPVRSSQPADNPTSAIRRRSGPV